jgi:hypothetical protein
VFKFADGKQPEKRTPPKVKHPEPRFYSTFTGVILSIIDRVKTSG